MIEHARWYEQRFGTIQPEWYVFAFGRPWPNDPTRPMVTLKTSWNNARKKAGVTGRWHDNRPTLITDLAESGAPDETIRDIAGHVSKADAEALLTYKDGREAGSTRRNRDETEAKGARHI